ncbi:2-amino-4-hydroxy-6-hydroxymethyldihydropteridine diphosphokinase [Gordonia sp. NB41Y]|uniref:2-amino-4-hydroxy-6- hydroxymethyldihydropteridine diphosphokinase n=1 Tax=Gordonia sp. NB41Y TaxID=875808 RepID=UPI00273CC844|nr:2-amino-4-hydroxy-6-hydroxymethyldihydropteridine diphosphokinase [Gordonia sp. NB41Y]WLP89202.1 2-amino-4-hydroxy-6-hydroxymethyldihydropteridine diphosphokinase [Gordonia sp. NB41Y]
MSRAVLSAGANVGDARGALRTVVDGFADELVAVSQVYATAPWGGVEQDDFLNITLVVEGNRTPREWLRRGAELEQAAHRTRNVRWGPRTLDVDVITVDDDGPVRSDDPVLTLPHPRAVHRAFVLVPWLEIDPDAMLWTPAGTRRVDDLVAALPSAEREGVRPAGRLDAPTPTDTSSGTAR